jgi:hypothetical protein
MFERVMLGDRMLGLFFLPVWAIYSRGRRTRAMFLGRSAIELAARRHILRNRLKTAPIEATNRLIARFILKYRVRARRLMTLQLFVGSMIITLICLFQHSPRLMFRRT